MSVLPPLSLSRAHPTTYMLGAVFAVQVALAIWLRAVQPYWPVLPPAPTPRALAAQSFGDPEFTYRLRVMELQNFGDTGGRTVALKDYDMNVAAQWLRALDLLDSKADHHVLLAARYFGLTQNTADVEPLVRYIQEHVALNPERKLQWLQDALYLAQARLKDMDLALSVVDQLAEYDFPAMSTLAYQLPALVHEKAQDYVRAVRLMERALERTRGRGQAQEIAFMESFIQNAQAKMAGPSGPNRDETLHHK